jgi:putative aldouronate transport system permease protein
MKQKPKVLSLRKRISQQKMLLLMVLPGFIWYVVFKYLPMLGLSLAFTDYGFRAKVSFIGLKNLNPNLHRGDGEVHLEAWNAVYLR